MLMFQLTELLDVPLLSITLVQPFGAGLAIANFTLKSKTGEPALANQLQEAGKRNYVSGSLIDISTLIVRGIS